MPLNPFCHLVYYREIDSRGWVLWLLYSMMDNCVGDCQKRMVVVVVDYTVDMTIDHRMDIGALDGIVEFVDIVADGRVHVVLV